MGANGLPVAISARPPVQAIRSAGFASARGGGLESAKMIGLSVFAAISLTMASVKLPEAVDAPMSIVGFTRLTTSAKLTPFPSQSCFQPRSEEHTSELQSLRHLVCRLLLEK